MRKNLEVWAGFTLMLSEIMMGSNEAKKWGQSSKRWPEGELNYRTIESVWEQAAAGGSVSKAKDLWELVKRLKGLNHYWVIQWQQEAQTPEMSEKMSNRVVLEDNTARCETEQEGRRWKKRTIWRAISQYIYSNMIKEVLGESVSRHHLYLEKVIKYSRKERKGN